MNANALIAEFSNRLDLPVDVNDVAECLRASGDDTDIQFIGVDLDPEILQGKIKVFYLRNGVYAADPQKHANIYYHRGHTADWQRFICCKELIHLVDPESAMTSSPEAIDALAEKIGLPPEMQDPLADGFAANIDRMAEYRAIAILFPLAAREALLSPHADGKITTTDIARLTDIPRRYVSFVMSEFWPGIHDLLTKG